MTPELDSHLIAGKTSPRSLAVAYVVRIAVEGLLDIVDYLRGPWPAAVTRAAFSWPSHHPSSDADDLKRPSEGPEQNPDGWKKLTPKRLDSYRVLQ